MLVRSVCNKATKEMDEDLRILSIALREVGGWLGVWRCSGND